MNLSLATLLTLLPGTCVPLWAGPSPAAGETPDWVFLDNGTIRLGVKKSSGAGIAWFSRSGETGNLLDHHDHGRLVQQSYYGLKDGSDWNGQPWTWNPVQGGDWKGAASQVLELKYTATTLKAMIRPRNWAGGQLLGDCVMNQAIRLEGPAAIIRFEFRYTGTVTHPVRDQEIPATFVNPVFGTLVHYAGDAPWTGGILTKSRPGWPNESRDLPEGWAAWINGANTGVGVYSPLAKNLTCYRFGSSPDAPGACSYFAPLVRFAVTPGLHFEYECALTAGTPGEIRAVFAGLHGKLAGKLPVAEKP